MVNGKTTKGETVTSIHRFRSVLNAKKRTVNGQTVNGIGNVFFTYTVSEGLYAYV